MLDTIKKTLRDIFTEPDGQTICPVRVGAAMVGSLYHMAATVGLFTHALQLDMAALGQYMQHMMELVAGGGLTVGVKSVLRADAKDTQP